MKRAVVLGGGGAKGAYEIGCWRALRELGVGWEIVTGSSVGAINGAMMAEGDYDSAREMWSRMTTADAFTVGERKTAAAIPQAVRKNVSLSGVMDGFISLAVEKRLDPAPLEGLLRRYVDERAVRASGAELGVSVTEYPSMRHEAAVIGRIPEGGLVDMLLASSAFFPAIDPKEAMGKKYVDGGYSDNLPLALALDMGADEAVAVDLQAVGVIRPVRADAPVRTIRCHWNLGPLMEFDPAVSARNMALGYNDALKSYGLYEGVAYTFENGTYQRHAARLGRAFAQLLERARPLAAKALPVRAGAPAAKSFAELSGVRPGLLPRRIVTAAAEAAGEVLGVSPLAVWSADSFDEALFAAFVPFRESPAALLEEALAKKEPIAEKAAALGTLAEGGAAAAYVASRAGGFFSGGELPADLRLLAGLRPREFFAGFYLYALAQL